MVLAVSHVAAKVAKRRFLAAAEADVVIRYAVLRWLGCMGLIWLILTVALS